MRWSASVAVALRGGRGSQHLRPDPDVDRHRRWRSPSGAAEDRNRSSSVASRDVHRCGGRPPGRPRIATRWGWGGWRVGCSGGRPPGRPRIATPVRWWRSSSASGGGRPPGRPRIATSDQPATQPVTRGWRSPSGAAKDRNVLSWAPSHAASPWRSPSGAAEDRNGMRRAAWAPGPHVAVALRGGRGSQRHGLGDGGHRGIVAVALRGGRGSQQRRCGRRPGRGRRWRSPSGAAEDRNLDTATGTLVWQGVAVALRGGRGSQPRHRDRHPGLAGRGGRPPGRPRILPSSLATWDLPLPPQTTMATFLTVLQHREVEVIGEPTRGTCCVWPLSCLFSSAVLREPSTDDRRRHAPWLPWCSTP